MCVYMRACASTVCIYLILLSFLLLGKYLCYIGFLLRHFSNMEILIKWMRISVFLRRRRRR